MHRTHSVACRVRLACRELSSATCWQIPHLRTFTLWGAVDGCKGHLPPCMAVMHVKSQDATCSQCTVTVVSKIKRSPSAWAGGRHKEAGLAVVRAKPPGAEMKRGLSESGRGCHSRP